MTLLLDLPFIPEAHKLVTDQGVEESLPQSNQEDSIPRMSETTGNITVTKHY